MTIERGIQVSVTLTGSGWANVELRARGGEVSFAASHLGDSIRSLVEATTAAVQGFAATPSFEDEPGQTRLSFQPVDDVVEISVLTFSETFSTLPNSSDTVIFESSCRKLPLARTVLSSMDKLLRTHGLDRYRKAWGFEFPTQPLAILRLEFDKQQRDASM